MCVLVKSLYKNDSKVEMVLTFFFVILQIRTGEENRCVYDFMSNIDVETEISTGTST